MWFTVKRHPTCKDGTRNLFRSVELLRSLAPSVQNIVRPVIQRNAYWAHPEAILLGMLSDPDPKVRREAVSKIVQCSAEASDELRQYQLPKINFDAVHYSQLIDWSKERIIEPPLTLSVSEADLLSFGESVPKFPVHTQAVERAVQVVTQAASAVVGQEARHGYICARLKHTKLVPMFESKKDFFVS